ncbi:arylesterase [Pontibacter anaerobius]|uniref:Arylesterase n=1 Tax=Pontibacter anaerobius TaxID=2993940 RepID=A0ABT3RD33_9BACT|nr:arylesterase [Pontibacter anaerobius]MCX2739359.1 arylesterase [Pontibacter anaerobius]
MTIKNQFLAFGLAAITTFYGCGDATTTDNLDKEKGARAATSAQSDAATETDTKTILFFGNSLTAGYGLDDPSQAFPALIQQRIDSLDMPYKVINAGLSGETTAGGKSRVDWLLKKQPVDIFVLELGANDGLRGIATEETYANLKTIIQKVRAHNPDVQVVLTGMQVPPSMGQKYSQDFSKVFTRVAEEENVSLVPFLLEGVGGEPELNQVDGIHPTEEGQKILANNVWDVLQPLLKQEETL